MGIGGEYAAINSAIDELIPARNRGRVDLAINGSYWVGAAARRPRRAAAARHVASSPRDLGWRLAFGAGAILGLGDPARAPPRPREPALAVHPRPRGGGRADRRPDRGGGARARPAQELPEPQGDRSRSASATRSRSASSRGRRPSATRAARSSGSRCSSARRSSTTPSTSTSGRSCTTSSTSARAHVPYLFVVFAVSNFLGPLLLGRLFDTVGRIPMIAGHLPRLGRAGRASRRPAARAALTTWSFMALVLAAFFLASAGASSAYLTVSEVFPMETRALAIALFYAVGTAVGGIAGPVLFGAAHPQRRRRPGRAPASSSAPPRWRSAASPSCSSASAPSSSRSRTSPGR